MRTMKMNQQAGLDAMPAAVCTTDEAVQANGSFQFGSYGSQGAGEQLLLSSLTEGSIILSADAASGLIYMIEEEKMARDLYDAFFDQTGSTVFDRISDSEQQHYDTLITVADAAGIDLSAISTTVGVFTNPEIQSLYDLLLAQGSLSLDAAYEVGVLVEQTDIADLQNYITGEDIGIVGTIYEHLEVGSEHHLATFSQYADLV